MTSNTIGFLRAAGITTICSSKPLLCWPGCSPSSYYAKGMAGVSRVLHLPVTVGSNLFQMRIHTVWSVNDGLSGNLWKQAAAVSSGVSRFFINTFFLNFLIIEKSGNLRETAAANFWRCLVGFRIIHH